ncbi:MAG: quinate 5-dehydrogenase [Actinomycetota bacterium]|nr:quinate 5-dehydrogenase [Actinomycetota bacterium]
MSSRVKEVVSVSIGSSTRDHEVELDLLGQRVRIRREGTDGDVAAAKARFEELDGHVDALGMGGIDLLLRIGTREYFFRDAKHMISGVTKTPVVDGTGLKHVLEARAVEWMSKELRLDLKGKRALMTAAVDRYGMAEALYEAGCEMSYGDLLYALGVPVLIHRRPTLHVMIRVVAPVATKLPFTWLYPTGEEQERPAQETKADLYHSNDVIAGDYLYVRKFMPSDMTGAWVITNTTTAADVEDLRGRRVELLVTSTPRLEGRSFGTNAMEAAMVALAGADGELPPEVYMGMVQQMGFTPDVTWLQQGSAASAV